MTAAAGAPGPSFRPKNPGLAGQTALRGASGHYALQPITRRKTALYKSSILDLSSWQATQAKLPLLYANEEKPMHISASAPTAHAMQIARAPEAMEGPGPDHDGDADDKGVSAVSSQPPAAPAGMGKSVNLTA